MDNRQIDVMVAQYVMGFHIHPQFSEWLGYPIKNDEVDYFEPTIIPNYTTDIAAAWQVIEKMMSLGWSYEVFSAVDLDSHSCRFGKGNYDRYENEWDEEFWGIGTAPLAICLAALKAVGVDYTEQQKEE